MNCLPVIGMEMRAASRRRAAYLLRLLFAATGGAACLIVLAASNAPPSEKGRTMLHVLSFLTLGFCLVAGGFLTADSVSSEKREGTLGLLFLTPLTGLDIVLGKLFCHGLQVFYAIAAVSPVFFLPLLTGGVTWGEVTRILLSLGLALMLSACVGMLVSVLGTDSRTTVLRTIGLVFVLSAVPMVYLVVRKAVFSWVPQGMTLAQLSPVFTVLLAFDGRYALTGGAALFWGSAGGLLLLSIALVLSAGALAGRVFARGGEVRSPRPTRSTTGRGLKFPVGELSPYEWLMLRSAREGSRVGLLVWGMLAFFVFNLFFSVGTSHWQMGFSMAFFTALVVHLWTKLRLAVEGTRQINSDRRSGALELLLVTTTSEAALVDGHQRALRTLFRKSLFLLLGMNAALELWVFLFAKELHMGSSDRVVFSSMFIGGAVLAVADFPALRWLALRQGVTSGNHLRTALRAFGLTMLVPWTCFGLIVAVISAVQPKEQIFAAIFGVWVGATVFYDFMVVLLTRERLFRPGLRRLASES